ncbi:hypothetical protein MOD31_11240 [Paenarthrobacter sp. TYUT067]|uniref:hypothetical protein n=1 Tax=Paenarthrobacter sp. TYUT067 TaxID=2926245 RepID=UPI0020305C0E|nr:hypothetical protein [Paenarthrobacter sp. TYUT067]MCM0616599.1 hypothetical protein [Paenarthrobacter sp. TYUT067]
MNKTSAGTGTAAGGRLRWGILLAVTALVLAGAGIYAVGAYQRFEESRSAASSVDVTAVAVTGLNGPGRTVILGPTS